MQGLNETGGSNAPANSHKSGYKRYMPTLVAFVVPAVVSGMVAAFVFADAKQRVAPESDLALRVEMVRYAAQKVPTVAGPGVSLARTNAEHPPLDNVTLAATPELDVASR